MIIDIIKNIVLISERERMDRREDSKKTKSRGNRKPRCDDSIKELPRYTAIDLFAGIGGIRLGFEYPASRPPLHYDGDTRIETVGVCEIDEDAITTYCNYYTDVDRASIHRNVLDYAIPDEQNVDICLAGFPCQAFSMAGKREGTSDERGRLFYEVTRICRDCKPKVIFCENVKGLLSMGPPTELDHETNLKIGSVFRGMKSELEDMGYNVHYTVLNSIYFGVPQNRERVYIVAFNKDKIKKDTFEFPAQIHDDGNVIDNILDPNPSVDLYLSEQYFNTLKRHRQYHESKSHGFGYVVKKRNEGMTSNALMCGGMGRERNLVYDPIELPETNSKGKKLNTEGIRMMSPLEWERLQGFPDGYTSAVPKTHRYNQLGNTVTVNVIQRIAENIFKVLDDPDNQ